MVYNCFLVSFSTSTLFRLKNVFKKHFIVAQKGLTKVHLISCGRKFFTLLYQLFHDGGSYHIETRFVQQINGLVVMKELNYRSVLQGKSLYGNIFDTAFMKLFLLQLILVSLVSTKSSYVFEQTCSWKHYSKEMWSKKIFWTRCCIWGGFIEKLLCHQRTCRGKLFFC